MLEISVKRGEFHIPQVEMKHGHFMQKKRQSYLDLMEILEEWSRENLILSDEDYDKQIVEKMHKHTINFSQMTEIQEGIFNETKFQDMDIQSMLCNLQERQSNLTPKNKFRNQVTNEKRIVTIDTENSFNSSIEKELHLTIYSNDCLNDGVMNKNQRYGMQNSFDEDKKMPNNINKKPGYTIGSKTSKIKPVYEQDEFDESIVTRWDDPEIQKIFKKNDESQREYNLKQNIIKNNEEIQPISKMQKHKSNEIPEKKPINSKILEKKPMRNKTPEKRPTIQQKILDKMSLNSKSLGKSPISNKSDEKKSLSSKSPEKRPKNNISPEKTPYSIFLEDSTNNIRTASPYHKIEPYKKAINKVSKNTPPPATECEIQEEKDEKVSSKIFEDEMITSLIQEDSLGKNFKRIKDESLLSNATAKSSNNSKGKKKNGKIEKKSEEIVIDVEVKESTPFVPGESVITVDMFGNLKQWSVNEHALEHNWGKVFQNQVDCMAITPGGKYQFISGSNGIMKQWHTKNRTLEKDWGQIHKRSIYCMVIMPTSDFLFSAGIDKHLKQWDLQSNTLFNDYGIIHENSIVSMAITPKEDILYTASASRRQLKWALIEDLDSYDYGRIHQSPINSMIITPDGKFLFTSSNDKNFKQWIIKTNKLYKEYKEAHKDSIKCMAISNDGKFLYTGSEDCELKQWNIEEGIVEHNFGKVHNRGVKQLLLTPDGQYLITSGGDKIMKQWCLQENLLCWDYGEIHDTNIQSMILIS